MFYIHKSHRRAKDVALMHIGPTLVVFTAFMGLTLWGWINAHRALQRQRNDFLTREVEQTTATLESRLETYNDILRAATGLFEASEEVSREEWNSFVDVFDLNNRYPGVSAVGYIQVVNANKLSAHVRQQRQTTPAYQIRPEGKRSLYTPLVYLRATTSSGQHAIGYDMYTDSSRREALDSARDSGKPAVSVPLQLLPDSNNQRHDGFLIFAPVYSRGPVPATLSERRSRIIGYVYMPFRSYNLISKAVSDDNPAFGFQVSYVTANNTTPLYENRFYSETTQSTKQWSIDKTFPVENQQWTIKGVISEQALPQNERNRPAGVLWGGTLFSVFVAGFIYLLLLNRTRALAHQEATELQEAKDELLALASHQLRTPATGVKQYIGMLREGYAGPLTGEQQTFVEKAYQSNERQLGTINEMLVVAKADAGYLELNKTNFDLNYLASSILEELSESIQSRRQTIKTYMPAQHLHIHADEQFTRMAIENIINNATKYTPEGGKITVTLLQKKGKIHISVRDTGVGISRGDEVLLFQKFSRIPNELTNKVGGSGIGLYLAQKIIDAHGGKITYSSEPRKGSIFTIILPTRKAAPKP